jgi:hypothetical protein
MGNAHTMAAPKVAPFTVAAAVEATNAMDMAKKMAASSNCKLVEADEAGATDKPGHQARHVLTFFCLLIPPLFFLFRRSPEFALDRAC